MKGRAGVIFCVIGGLFLVNAVFGRYIVLPGYLERLEAGGGIPEGVPLIKIIRYVVWAFSFKLGVFFFIIGALLCRSKPRKEILVFSGAGLVYIALAYAPLPFQSSLFFGVGGAIVTAVSLILLWTIAGGRHCGGKGGGLLECLGIFFIVNGIYNLCPLMGVRCFALYPEKMMRYNLQEDAFSFANHIMIEFALGLSFLLAARIRQTTRRAS
jgi:hypothetical protein